MDTMTDDYTRPDFKRSVLMTIDTQNDFTLPGAAAEIVGTIDILPNMAMLLDINSLTRSRPGPVQFYAIVFITT